MFIGRTNEGGATERVAEYFAAQRAFWGFLPNYAHCFAGRPEVADAWSALNTAIREGMDRRRYELATLAAARQRRSTYCSIAHASFLRDVCQDEATVRALACDASGGLLQETDRLIYRFATKVAADAASVTQHDVDELRSAGLADEDIAGVVQAVAARLFFTAVLDGLGALTDPQTAGTFEPDLLTFLTVGRPVAHDVS